MTRWIAKPFLANNMGIKEFDNPKDAVEYLNEMLTDVDVDPELDYVFSTLSTTESRLEDSIDDFMNVRKLLMVIE